MGKKKNPEIRIATVEMDRGQSEMATLPAGHRGVGTSEEAPEKHNDTNREMEERLESPPKRFTTLSHFIHGESVSSRHFSCRHFSRALILELARPRSR